MTYWHRAFGNFAAPPDLVNEPERSEQAARERAEAQERVETKRALRRVLMILTGEAE